MIDYFCDWQYEGGFCIQIESIEVMNPDVKQCNELINELERLLFDLNKHKDMLKEL